MVEKKEKKEKVIQLVDQPRVCVIVGKNIKKVLKEFLGKRVIQLNLSNFYLDILL